MNLTDLLPPSPGGPDDPFNRDGRQPIGIPEGDARMPVLSLEELRSRAKDFDPIAAAVELWFDEAHYVRTVLHCDADLEVALICFEDGQSSSIHHHRGSGCVVRVLAGRFLERLFEVDAASGLYVESDARLLSPGDISGLDGSQIHQMSNALARDRGVLVNFYSPPFG